MSLETDRREKIGDLAEDYFRLYCRKCNLSPTQTGKDKFGWDFFVECPINRLPYVDLDAQPPAIKLLCQVKSTDDFEKRQISMTVSNWQKLATSPLPAFVFIIDFNKNDEPAGLWLCHIDTRRIGEALQRIRKLQAEAKIDLHNHEMTLTATDDEKIGDIEIANAIRKAVGFDLSAYTTSKSATLKAIGFEQGRYKLDISTKMRASEFADALVGIGEVNIQSGSISSIRFGISIQQETIGAGTIKFSPAEVSRCEVSVTSKDSFSKESFEGSVFASHVSTDDSSLNRIKISLGSIITILISSDKSKFHFEILPDTIYSLSILQKACVFILACRRGAKISLTADATTFYEIELENEVRASAELAAYAERSKMIRRFLDFAEIRDDVTLRPRDLFEPKDSFEWLGLALTTKGNIANEVENKTVALRKDGILASIVHLHLNEMNYVAFVYWKSVFRIKSGKLKAVTRNAKIFDSLMVDDGNLGPLKESYGRFEAFAKSIANGSLMIRSLSIDDSKP